MKCRALPLWLFVLAFAFAGALERAAAADEVQCPPDPARARASSPRGDLSAPFGFTMTFAAVRACARAPSDLALPSRWARAAPTPRPRRARRSTAAGGAYCA